MVEGGVVVEGVAGVPPVDGGAGVVAPGTGAVTSLVFTPCFCRFFCAFWIAFRRFCRCFSVSW
jgi:hypothetical protein